MPQRERIQLEALGAYLGNLALVELTRLPFRPRYRLVGTAINGHADTELTGRYVNQLYSRRIPREEMRAHAEATDSRQTQFRLLRFWLIGNTFG